MERYTMKDFMEKHICVNLSQPKHRAAFMAECDNAGVLWYGEKKPNDVWHEGCPFVCYENGHLACASQPHTWQEVQFSAFDFAQPTAEQPDQKITIEEIDAAIAGLRKMRDKLSMPGPNGFKTHELHIYADDKRVWATYKHGNAVERFEAKRDIKQMFAGVVASINDTMKYVSDAEKPDERKPAPAPWKPAVGDLVQIVHQSMLGCFDVGSIVKIDNICSKGHPCAKDKSGTLACLAPSGSYLPVREVDRPAKDGEWVKIVSAHPQGPVKYKDGDTLEVTAMDDWNDPMVGTSASDWLHRDEYRVLEPYSPEVPHA